MTTIQKEIIIALQVNAELNNDAALLAEIERRKTFIKETVLSSKTSALVLGISGGVDSLTAGLLCQAAARELTVDGYECRFIAMRLPYGEQRDEDDAQLSLSIINPDFTETSNIQPAVDGMMDQFRLHYTPAKVDFVKGNVKARARMIAQYAVANFNNGLVVGTDHAAEAVMGFFTKFGDGACDLTPLAGLVKGQVRAIAKLLGAPDSLVYKTPTADLEDLDPGKPDEVAYGCTYEQIDAFLLGNEVPASVEQAIIAQYEKTEHKRNLPYGPQ